MTTFLKQYYERYDEDNRLTSKTGRIEFLTTTRYIDKYLKEGDKLLEVGSGTGIYSLHYAEKGYDVTSVELVQHNIDICKQKIKPHHTIDVMQGNALDLSRFDDHTFDVTLVLGPLYHLYTYEDQMQAIKEAYRVTKKDGIIVFAYLTNDSVVLNWGLIEGNLMHGITSGMFTDSFKCLSRPEDVFVMFYVEEFTNMVNQLDVTHLHTVATDGMTQHFESKIEALDDETYNAWLSYHYSTCERSDLVGYSNHVIYIGKKKKLNTYM